MSVRLLPIRWLVLLLGVLISGATGCGRDGLEGDPGCTELQLSSRPGRIPVVIVLNDAMRRDRAGVYGGAAKTPTFDRFARENLLFTAATTQAPWTLPSISTLFTSLHPSQHGVETEVGVPQESLLLPESVTTLAEVFKAAGYRTGAFVSNPWMAPRFGFAQGFDVYEDSADWTHDGTKLSEAALAWVRQIPKGEPYFLYLHYVDSHRPYPVLTMEDLKAGADRIQADKRPVSDAVRQEIHSVVSTGKAGMSGALVERRIALVELAYEKGIGSFDQAFKVFLDGFEQTPSARDAAMIVTSDHGEALYDRGYGNHGQGLFEDELAIPLAARLPGVRASPNPVSCQVGLIDVMPTLCDYLGLECPKPIFGRSFFERGGAPRFLASEGVGGQPRHRAVRSTEWKLMWEPDQPPDGPRENPYRLFHLSKDPQEREDLAGSDAAEARRAREQLEEELHAAVPVVARPSSRSTPIDPALEKRLRGLGYLGEKPERK